MSTSRIRVALGLLLALAGGLSLARHVAGQAENTKEATHEASRKVKSQVRPTFPSLAREMNLSGSVKIEVLVAPDGKVKRTRVLGGHPLLVGPAEDAVKRWRFAPGPKETKEIIEFRFNNSAS